MMKNKLAVGGVIFGMLFTYLVEAKTVSAFWLFDVLRGRVKGEQTGSQYGGQPSDKRPYQQQQNQQQRMGGQQSGVPSAGSGQGPSVGSGQVGGGMSEEQVGRLVKEGKLSSSKASELLSRLRAIKAKRSELLAMEKELVEWLRSNRLETSNSGQVTPTTTQYGGSETENRGRKMGERYQQDGGRQPYGGVQDGTSLTPGQER